MSYQPETIRLVFFITVLVICAFCESNAPRKTLSQNKCIRWINNLGLVGLNSMLITLLMPIVAVSAAHWAELHSFGLMNWLHISTTTSVILSIVVLDGIIYWQHQLFHSVPLLWRLHAMHHADQDIDVTTGTRFHPVEILISMWVKIGAVTLLGAPVWAVIAFEIILNASAMFNHSNARLPLKLDKWLRLVIVTPDMHRVHHSVIERETHSNFGFFLSIWDRLFSTYVAQPALGHDGMKIGLPVFKQSREQWLDKMLTQPFREN